MTERYRITVDLAAEEYLNLSRLKAREERSFAWLGRQAISEYIEKHIESKDSQLQLEAHGSKRASE